MVGPVREVDAQAVGGGDSVAVCLHGIKLRGSGGDEEPEPLLEPNSDLIRALLVRARHDTEPVPRVLERHGDQTRAFHIDKGGGGVANRVMKVDALAVNEQTAPAHHGEQSSRRTAGRVE